MTRMAKPLMPEVDRGDASERSRKRRGATSHRVQITVRLTAENHCPSAKVVDRKTKRVKFNRYMVISTELTNIKEVFNERWRKQNMAKNKRGSRSDDRAGASMCDRQVSTITDHDLRGRMRRTEGVKVTGARRHVRQPPGVEVPIRGAARNRRLRRGAA
jgi:metal-sulfur cluster biosynthetic enzyme